MPSTYVGVAAVGGIITTVIIHQDLEALKSLMMYRHPEDEFDPESDDMRIFDDEGDEVYCFYSEE